MKNPVHQDSDSATDPNGEILVRRALRGDVEAEAELFVMVRECARTLCRGKGPAGFDADWEDVAQAAAQRMFENGLHQYSGGKIRSFVFVIVKRTIIRMARTHRRRVRREEEVHRDRVSREPDYPHLDVEAILGKLTDRCRDLLIRVFVWDVAYRELAGAMGLQESSVRSRVARCVARARELTEGRSS